MLDAAAGADRGGDLRQPAQHARGAEAAVEAVEMVTIVLGVGATRGWRATLVGSAAGFGVLAVVVAAAGLALAFTLMPETRSKEGESE